MLTRIKRAINAVRDADPGERFEFAHERHRIDNHVVRIVVICLGGALLIGGAVTFWVPGPNFVIVLAGLALVAGQWRAVAKLMDRAEVYTRRWHREKWAPYQHKTRVIAFAWVVFAAAVATVAWLAHSQGWLPAFLQ